MTLDECLRRLLLSDDAIRARVQDRVRPVVLATEDEGDSIVYLLEGDTRVVTQDGPTAEDDGDVKLKLGIRSRDYDRMRELRALAIAKLNAFSAISNGIDLTIFYDDDTDDSVYEDEGDEHPIYTQSADFNVMYRTAP